MTEILQLEFAQQFPTFVAALIYFAFWGGVAVLVILLGTAIYDKIWGPINLSGDFLRDFEKGIQKIKQWLDLRLTGKAIYYPEDGGSILVNTAPEPIEVVETAFDFPTYAVRNRPFDREWDV
jgi:hypothetical protein